MLTIKEISVSYGNRAVLRDVSFELGDGQIIVLLGANGAGKTTLIKALNGTLPISAGEINLNEQPLTSISRREIAKNIAVVAQENETRFPVTVLEFVLSGRFVHGGAFGWETDGDIRFAENALKDCDLAGYASRLMNELSGGERQRVVLARALATGAKILLLDEPTANLDLAHQAMMFRLVRERSRSCGASAVVITHDLNLAAEFADEILLLKDGRIAAKGAPSEVLTAENIDDVFGVKVLLDSNPASGNVRVTNVF
ncbi:MAG: ABC transporter ATP-binding protein [Acidobacteria bacterium]|nr:ABC transporter ATP-binding protein [Acidobacteriota bacterium]MBP7473860.1 ABC transporter ATP-binding protein [Pyrinomonadaceae bacterium]MBP9109220.1 ABC transporter ATP-binding protein [Pyrinomonadaceae bacterium]